MIGLLVHGPATATVRFSDWQETGMEPLLVQAARQRQPVLLVITQPDWCPPCILLEREVLGAPGETRLSGLSTDWLALKVHGYDAAGKALLQRHGIGFVGVPTTLLLRPAGQRRLGAMQRLASIVGFPADYVERLAAAARGEDPLRHARDAFAARNDIDSELELARQYAYRGDASSARQHYGAVLEHTDLDPRLRREIEWELVEQLSQRLEGDHARAMAEAEVFAQRYPESAAELDFVAFQAHNLFALGRPAEGLQRMQPFLDDDLGSEPLRRLLYLVFLYPEPAMLTLALRLAEQGLLEYPEDAARLHAASGRLLRRQQRPAEAVDAFTRAVALSRETDPEHDIYLAQLEHARRELANSTREEQR